MLGKISKDVWIYYILNCLNARDLLSFKLVSSEANAFVNQTKILPFWKTCKCFDGDLKFANSKNWYGIADAIYIKKIIPMKNSYKEEVPMNF